MDEKAAITIQHWYKKHANRRNTRWNKTYEGVSVIGVNESEKLEKSQSLGPKQAATTSNNNDIVGERVNRIMNLLRTVSYSNPETSPAKSEVSFSTSFSRPQSRLQTQHPSNELRSERVQVLKQEFELQEKTRLISAMKDEIGRLKDELQTQRKSFQEDITSKLSLQRKQFETIIKRTQTMLDKTVSEKEDIFKKFETLSDEFKVIEKQFKTKIQTMEENHALELKRRKELWESSEKLKRDRWIQEKSKSIKDQVMKGFEPEIQRMITQHKAQLLRKEEQLKADFMKEKQQLIDENGAQIDIYREKIATERRRAADEEREIARQRYQKQLERDELDLQQQRRKMSAQMDEEKDRLLSAWREEKKKEIEVWRVKCDDLQRAVTDARRENAVSQERKQKEHEAALQEQKEVLGRENEEWRQIFMKQALKDHEKREKEVLEKLIKERDAEIEAVVKRLEEETYSCSNTLHLEHRREIEKLSAEHKEEMRIMQTQLNNALEKIMALEEELHEKQEQDKNDRREVLRVQNEVTSKDALLQEQKAELQRLRAQRADLRATIEKELQRELEGMQLRVKALEKAVTTKDHEVERTRKEASEKVNQAMRAKADELEHLEHSVTEALFQKDSEIENLKRKAETFEIRNSQLEQLLEQQRRELVKNL